ncbi:MAG: flagellar M-ring protein FliF [Bacteroidetes bacterium]|nr:flagellar M-ring protein FliF [Bacteroidota bacterium]
MGSFSQQFEQFFGPLSNAQRVMFVLLMAIVLSVAGGIFYWSQQQEEVLLFGDLGTQSAQDIIAALDERGITYSVENNGKAIYVESDKVHQLRLELASYGGADTGIKGYELFDSQTLGMTDFMQEVNRKRALEGELARSITSLDQVEQARIHLVLPERSPFQQASTQATASVIIGLQPGKKLTTAQIDGITALIAGSVDGLDANSVVVLDQAGNRLSSDSSADDNFAFGGSQMQLKQNTEAYLTNQGQTMLDRVLGAGNSILRVSVEHDFERIMRESDIIDPDSRTIISEQKSTQSNSNEERTPINSTDYTPVELMNETLITGTNTNESSNQTRNYEVNRTREVYEKNQGEIKRITASILLNYKTVQVTDEEGNTTMTTEPYSNEEIENFTRVVQLALGMSDQRGDNLTISQTEFFEHPFAQQAGYLQEQPRSLDTILRWVMIVLTFGLVVFLINRVRKNVSTGSFLQEPAMATTSNYRYDSNELGGMPSAKSLPAQDQSLSPTLSDLADESLNSSENKALLKKKDDVKDFFELKPMQAADIVRIMFDTSLISKL